MSSDEGSCPRHPAIRLKRYNGRTNVWKTLLDTCPLCASGLPASRGTLDDDRSVATSAVTAYSAAGTVNTRDTGNTDMTYVTDGKSLSSASTMRRGNSERAGNHPSHHADDDDYHHQDHDDDDSQDDKAPTDDEGYWTEDNEETMGIDSSCRSGTSSKGVRFGPGTKEASDAGTDLESETDVDDKNFDYMRDSIHSNCSDYDRDEMDGTNASFHSNNDLNEYMQRDIVDNQRSSVTSQYSNTPPVKNPMPSALKPSTIGSLVVYDDGSNKRQSEHDSSFTSLQDDESLQQHQQPKYKPPPPPRRDDESLLSPDRHARSSSRSRNERSSSRSRDAQHPTLSPPTHASSNGSSRARGNSSRGRDSSRSRRREGDPSRPLPPPGRARSQSRTRQPSRERSQPSQEQPPSRPVGILRNSTSSSRLYNPQESHHDDDQRSYEPYDDTTARNYSRPGPPPRSSGMSPAGTNRIRMEPPGTPTDELDNYSLDSRDAQHKRMVGSLPSRHGHPQQDHHRRLTDQSGQNSTRNNRIMSQSARTGPMYMHDDYRDNVPTRGYNRPSRGVQPPADHSESSSEHKSKPSRSNHTPKKSNRRKNDAAGYTESETQFSDPPGDTDKNASEVPIMTPASEYDDKGRCVKHPHIKLRKRKILGGWKVMLVNCPDCCIEEMLKMKRNGSGRGGDRKSTKRSPSEDSRSSGAHPPISQLTIRNKNDEDEDRSSSSGSASEITYGTKTDYSRSSNIGSWQQYNNSSADNSGTSGSGPHRVTRMPFTDAYGHKGWYTGEVTTGSGLPHGKGTIHYCDGRMKGGFWSNGLIATNSGGANPSRNPEKKVVSSGDSVGSHRSQHSRRSRSRHPPSGGRENVVVGMEWMDYDGKVGSYTGETDEKGRPHGMGSIRYNDGKVLEGGWYHGEFDRPNM